MKGEIHYCQYLVCMMDLLGQKEMYKELESYPFPIGNKESEFRERLIQFIRSIEYFKRDVDSFLDAASKYESQYDWPEHAVGFVSKINNDICKIQRFSDGIMIFVPLADTDVAFPISSVVTALLCAASTMLISLAKGNPIRVGIGIGGGVEIDDGELFGPAIGYAHEMESERAIFPRIAIHENVIGYLESHAPLINSSVKNIDHHFKYDISKLCNSMIKKDHDGVYILDYLGDAVWDSMFRGGNEELLRRAFEFVEKEKCRFEEEQNEKLFPKYSYLYQYFISSRQELLSVPNKMHL